MKTGKNIKFRIITLFFTIFGLVSFLSSNAQCEKRDLCSDDWEDDYDFRSQSSFAKLSPGDTSSVSLVLYSNQKYRIFVCSDEKLGAVSWKILNPERKTKRTIKEIKKDTVITYKSNEYGDFETDDEGNLIIQSKNVMIDTTWNTERITVNKVVYDNKKSTDKPYLDLLPKKSERYVVKIDVPGGNPNIDGCVNVYVGRIPVSSKSFNRGGNNRSGNSY